MGRSKKIEEQFLKDSFEKDAWIKGLVVCGIDEAGRGCLAGPLVTAAVILPKGVTFPLLKDSKIMSKRDRQIAYEWIQKHCWVGVGIVSHRIIDQQNIWHATLTGMRRALLQVLTIAPEAPSAVLVDAMPLTMVNTGCSDISIYHFIKGESRSSSIAAASIVAKVTRDALMEQMDTLFPAYAFAKHKGYGTVEHKTALKQVGHSIIHRSQFIRNIQYEMAHEEQQSLC